MYFVTKSGRKFNVDTSGVPESEFLPLFDSVGLYPETALLKDIWIVQLHKWERDYGGCKHSDNNLELINEVVYHEKPSQEQILWDMSANGLGLKDVVTIKEGFMLDCEWD